MAAAITPSVATGDAPDADYLALIDRFPLRAIRTEEDHDRAVKMMTWVVMNPAPRPGEILYRDALAALIEHHETAIYPEPTSTPAEMLRSLIESANVTQAEVARGANLNRSLISDILAGRRKASRKAAESLGEFFAVDPGTFIN